MKTPAVGPYICETCGVGGNTTSKYGGSLALELFLWLLFLLPGFVYHLWRATTKKTMVCKDCGGHMVLCDSPRGLKLVQEYYPDATAIKTPGWFAG